MAVCSFLLLGCFAVVLASSTGPLFSPRAKRYSSSKPWTSAFSPKTASLSGRPAVGIVEGELDPALLIDTDDIVRRENSPSPLRNFTPGVSEDVLVRRDKLYENFSKKDGDDYRIKARVSGTLTDEKFNGNGIIKGRRRAESAREGAGRREGKDGRNKFFLGSGTVTGAYDKKGKYNRKESRIRHDDDALREEGLNRNDRSGVRRKNLRKRYDDNDSHRGDDKQKSNNTSQVTDRNQHGRDDPKQDEGRKQEADGSAGLKTRQRDDEGGYNWDGGGDDDDDDVTRGKNDYGTTTDVYAQYLEKNPGEEIEDDGTTEDPDRYAGSTSTDSYITTTSLPDAFAIPDDGYRFVQEGEGQVVTTTELEEKATEYNYNYDDDDSGNRLKMVFNEEENKNYGLGWGDVGARPGSDKAATSRAIEIASVPSIVYIDFIHGVPGELKCTGHLITDQHVLTTSSCLRPNRTGNGSKTLGDYLPPDVLNVRVGSDFTGKEGEVYFVQDICIYPFSSDSRYYQRDVAVVTLEGKVEFGENVRATALGTIKWEVGCSIAGWVDDGSYTLRLRRHPVVSMPPVYCAGVLNYVPDENVVICAKKSSSDDFCLKFLGEGLFCDNRLVALVSGFRKDGRFCQDSLIALVRVDNINGFIEFATSQCSALLAPFLIFVLCRLSVPFLVCRFIFLLRSSNRCT